MASEDGLADTIRPRLEAAGAVLERILALTETPKGGGYAIPNDVELIERAVREMDAALLIIDPLVALLANDVNAFIDQDVRRALKPLSEMAERTRCAVINIRHLNKSQASSALYRASGSIGLIAAARSALLVAADPDDPEVRVLASLKSNLGRPAPSLAFRLVDDPATGVARVEYQGLSPHTKDTLLTVPQSTQPRPTKVAEAMAWLEEMLADGPVPTPDIEDAAKAERMSWATVRRAREKLGCVKIKMGFNGGWAWKLPEAEVDETKVLNEVASVPSPDHEHLREPVSIFGDPSQNKDDSAWSDDVGRPDDQDEWPFICPGCGDWPCHCNASDFPAA